jgi:hypothetical protein
MAITTAFRIAVVRAELAESIFLCHNSEISQLLFILENVMASFFSQFILIINHFSQVFVGKITFV